jgi:hypothetical protein
MPTGNDPVTWFTYAPPFDELLVEFCRGLGIPQIGIPANSPLSGRVEP